MGTRDRDRLSCKEMDDCISVIARGFRRSSSWLNERGVEGNGGGKQYRRYKFMIAYILEMRFSAFKAFKNLGVRIPRVCRCIWYPLPANHSDVSVTARLVEFLAAKVFILQVIDLLHCIHSGLPHKQGIYSWLLADLSLPLLHFSV